MNRRELLKRAAQLAGALGLTGLIAHEAATAPAAPALPVVAANPVWIGTADGCNAPTFEDLERLFKKSRYSRGEPDVVIAGLGYSSPSKKQP